MCFEISHMNSDNSIFASSQFRVYCDNKNQEQHFSVVGSKNQNARSYRSFQTIIYMSRTFMLHSYLHRTYHMVDNISLWSFVVNHDVWLHNHLPNYRSGIAPLELITSNNADHIDLRISHNWVCPVFVLGP